MTDIAPSRIFWLEQGLELVGEQVLAHWADGEGYRGEGRVISYSSEPTVTIEEPDGTRFSWLARLCERIEIAPLIWEGDNT